MMEKDECFVVFVLNQQRFALPLAVANRAARAVEITPLPNAPGIIQGIINVGGEVIPVINLRKRLNLPERETLPGDHLIIIRTAKRQVVLVVDLVDMVIEIPQQELTPAEEIVPRTGYLRGVIRLPDGMVLIHDVDAFLSPEEEIGLADAIDGYEYDDRQE